MNVSKPLLLACHFSASLCQIVVLLCLETSAHPNAHAAPTVTGSSSCQWPAADLMHMHSHWSVEASQEVAVRNYWWSCLIKLSLSSLYSSEKSVLIIWWRGGSNQTENCNALHMLTYLSVPLPVLLYLPTCAAWTGVRRAPCCWSRAYRPWDNIPVLPPLVWLQLWLWISMVSFPHLWLW